MEAEKVGAEEKETRRHTWREHPQDREESIGEEHLGAEVEQNFDGLFARSRESSRRMFQLRGMLQADVSVPILDV